MRHPTSSLFIFKSTKALDILSAVKKENKLYVHILILFIIDVIDLKWKQYRLEGTYLPISLFSYCGDYYWVATTVPQISRFLNLSRDARSS